MHDFGFVVFDGESVALLAAYVLGALVHVVDFLLLVVVFDALVQLLVHVSPFVVHGHAAHLLGLGLQLAIDVLELREERLLVALGFLLEFG